MWKDEGTDQTDYLVLLQDVATGKWCYVQTNHSAWDEGTDQADLSILLGDAATDFSTTTTIKGCRKHSAGRWGCCPD